MDDLHQKISLLKLISLSKGMNYIMKTMNIKLSEPIKHHLDFDSFLKVFSSKPLVKLDKVYEKVVKDFIISGKVRGKAVING